MEIIKGRVWVFEDNVDTDQILPGYAMAEKTENLASFAMAGSNISDFANRVKKGDIIVAGKNFGCGSSREQAPVALKEAGVSLVAAKSIARIFRRNAINIGLPVMIAEICDLVKTEDKIAVSIEEGIIRINGQVIEAAPLSENVLKTLRAGGLINRVKEELGLVKGR